VRGDRRRSDRGEAPGLRAPSPAAPSPAAPSPAAPRGGRPASLCGAFPRQRLAADARRPRPGPPRQTSRLRPGPGAPPDSPGPASENRAVQTTPRMDFSMRGSFSLDIPGRSPAPGRFQLCRYSIMPSSRSSITRRPS
jgi:hypothetical protein